MNTIFNLQPISVKLTLITQYLIVFTIIFFSIFLYDYYRRNRRYYQLISQLPGPPTLPIIGNAHFFIGNITKITSRAYKMKDSFASPYKIVLGPKVFVGITNPDHIAVILNNSLEKGDILTKFGAPWFGECLLVSKVPRWKHNRKLIVSTFTPKILETFLQTFVRQSEILVECLEPMVDGPQFDFWPFSSRASLDMICGTAMGITMNAQRQTSEYVDAVTSQLDIISYRSYKFWLHSDWIFSFTSLAKQQQRNVRILHDFNEKVIAEKKRAKQTDENENNSDDEYMRKNPKRKAFLDYLLEIHEKDPAFTETQLKEEVDVLLLGGYETTATTNGFSMLVFATHPEIQQRVCDELYDIFGESKRPVEMEDLAHMEYLERFIKEVLRMFPTLPMLLRNTTEDVTLGSYTIPSGTTCFIPVAAIHHDRGIWEKPRKFDPDRFLKEEIAKRHPYSYIPFSAGPRNCLGYKYAMIAMKTILSTVLRSYKISSDIKLDQLKFKLEATLKTAQGFPIKIEKRTKLRN